MEREEIEQIKKEIKEEIKDINERLKQLNSRHGWNNEGTHHLEIAKSNYYIALTNLI